MLKLAHGAPAFFLCLSHKKKAASSCFCSSLQHPTYDTFDLQSRLRTWQARLQNWNTGRIYLADKTSYGISSYGPVCKG